VQIDRARALGRGCLALILAASEGQARSDCDTSRSVALEIRDGTPATGGAASGAEQLRQNEQLERSVIAELGASQISVCALPSQPSTLARVQIRALLPAWQRASIRLESERSPALERDLDVSKLPPEARALAIASATDELIRSAFAAAAMASAEPAPSPAASNRVEPERVERDRAEPDALGSARPEPPPLVELGLAVGGSSYFGQREALEEDLAARYWLLPRLPLSARVGIAQRLSRPSERGAVQPDADVHAALGAGLTLWAEPGFFDVIGEAGMLLSRVGFDERVRLEGTPALLDNQGAATPSDNLSDDVLDEIPAAGQAYDQDQALDHGWALAASLGVEGRVRTGPLGFSLALAGLVPLVPARSDWGNQTSLDAFGMQLRAGVWMLLGSRKVP
jgi:hypothetical protein